MEKKTKIILGFSVLAIIAYVTREKWMPKKDAASGFNFSGGFIKSTPLSKKKKEPTYTDPKTGEVFVKNSTGAWILK